MKRLLFAILMLSAVMSTAQITPSAINSPRVATDWWVFRDTVIFGYLTAPYTGTPTVNLRIMPGALTLDNTDINFLTFDETTKNMQYRTFSSFVSSPLSISGSSITVLTQMSITSDVSGLKLVNDATTPGNSKFYGTTSTGVKGWRKIKKADFDDLDAYEILFGDQTGNGQVEQSDDFFYDDVNIGYPSVILRNTDAGIFLSTDNNYLTAPIDGVSHGILSASGFTTTNGASPQYSGRYNFDEMTVSYGLLGVQQDAISLTHDQLQFYTLGAKNTNIKRTTGGAQYTLFLPNDIDIAGKALGISSVSPGNVANLGWLTIPTVPSFIDGNATTWDGAAFDLGGSMDNDVTIDGAGFNFTMNNAGGVSFNSVTGFSVESDIGYDITFTTGSSFNTNSQSLNLITSQYMNFSAGTDIVISAANDTKVENIDQNDAATKVMVLDGDYVRWRDYATFTGLGGTVTDVALQVTNTGGVGATIDVSGSPVTSSGTFSLNIPDAGIGVLRGVVTNGTQTFEGAKTFNNTTSFNDDALFLDVAWFGTNKTKINSSGQWFLYNNVTPAAGMFMKGNGTIYDNLALGTANQVMAVNSGATDAGWTTLSTTNVTEGSNLYHTTERSQDDWGAMINASLQYVDGTPLAAIADRDFGDLTTTSSGTVMTVDNNAISYAKLQQGAAHTMLANNTSGSANFAETPFEFHNSATYTGTYTMIAGTTAPSGTTNHSYTWQRIGNVVTLEIWIIFGTNGNAVTSASLTLPTDCPSPSEPPGLTAGSDRLYSGTGWMENNTSSSPGASRVFLRRNAGDTAYEIVCLAGSNNGNCMHINITYYAQ